MIKYVQIFRCCRVKHLSKYKECRSVNDDEEYGELAKQSETEDEEAETEAETETDIG